MTVLAIGVGTAILAWATVAIALVGALAAVALLTRVVQPALEIKRYAEDTLEAGLAIARNLDGADELARTRELALTVPQRASRYLERVGGGPA